MSTRAMETCPDCGAALRAGDLLIEYEHATVGTSGFAECRDCGRVVKVSL